MLTRAAKVLTALSCCALLIRGAEETGAEARKADIESFELVWKTLRDRYWDQSMAGLDWQSVHDRYLPQVQRARSRAEARGVINSMVRLLPSSHLAIIPGELYRFPDTKGKFVHFKQKQQSERVSNGYSRRRRFGSNRLDGRAGR